MEKQTKQTLKVLSTLALASAVVLGNGGTADAKSYKPEVRYDGKDYFIKTSDPEATGKTLHFSTDGSNTPNTRAEVSILYSYFNYKGEELNISKYYKMGELSKSFTRDTPFSIIDDEHGFLISDDEATRNKKRENFVKSAKAGFTTVNKLNKVEKSTESTQPTGPEQPVQPVGPEQPVELTGPKEPAQPKKSALSEIVGAGEAQNNPKDKELFGQLETTSNKDDKKVESTIKSEGKVNAKKALPNTGLQTSSYALLGSIIGLVGIMALRRKKSN